MENVLIYPNVWLPDDAQLDPFVIVGEPPRGLEPGALRTEIGAGCLLRSHTVIYAGNVIGVHFQTGHGVMVRENNTIGDHVSIGTQSIVEHHVTIADGVRIHSQAFIPEYTVLEAGCWIGPNAVLTNARYPLSPGVKDRLEGPRVGAGAMIGANSTLLPGVKVGAQALVGAGAVVVRDVPPGKVVVGNPARVIRDLDEISYYRRLQAER